MSGQIKKKRMTGVGPACEAWEASILPLYYIRTDRITIPYLQTDCKQFSQFLFSQFLNFAKPCTQTLLKKFVSAQFHSVSAGLSE